MYLKYKQACNELPQTLDFWTQKTVDGLALSVGASALYPFSRPYLPFQKWARRAKAGFQSPLGLNIHPIYGLWHGYRALLVFDHDVELPEQKNASHPCSDCTEELCLAACPVNAFDGTQYNAADCRSFLIENPHADCHKTGCKARRACPVGADYAYEIDQTKFHMAAFANSGKQD